MFDKYAAEAKELYEKISTKLVELSNDKKYEKTFQDFALEFKKNVNSIFSVEDAIEILSQYIIIEPIFNSIFIDYSFMDYNRISLEIRNVLKHFSQDLKDLILERNKILDGFYKKINKMSNNVKTAEERHILINQIYDNFLKIVFPKLQHQLGIVHTPPEIVNFILNSINDVLKEEFNCDLNSENVNIIDPFTGTGTFISQLLRSGLINKSNLERKYKKEIFANEIVPLGYFIATANIEEAFRDASESKEYVPFHNLNLVDTFETF